MLNNKKHKDFWVEIYPTAVFGDEPITWTYNIHYDSGSMVGSAWQFDSPYAAVAKAFESLSSDKLVKDSLRLPKIVVQESHYDYILARSQRDSLRQRRRK